MEHASIASFGKLALELLSLGAPATLVAGAHEAALSEVRHAELCFALASRYLDAPVGPGSLPGAAVVRGAQPLEELAVAAVHEGCVNETIAAALASVQLAASTDEAVRATLAVIAEDESAHAELAYRVVAWAIKVGGDSVRCSVAGAFHEAIQKIRLAEVVEPDPEDPDLSALRAHGRLSPHERQAESGRVIDGVIIPAMRVLCGNFA